MSVLHVQLWGDLLIAKHMRMHPVAFEMDMLRERHRRGDVYT